VIDVPRIFKKPAPICVDTTMALREGIAGTHSDMATANNSRFADLGKGQSEPGRLTSVLSGGWGGKDSTMP